MIGRRYGWRLLTPAQEQAIARLYAQRPGRARDRELAAAYGVSVRTIHRAIERCREDRPLHEITVGDWRATFELSPLGPVQRTPWVPA